MEATLTKWGNSQGILIPKALCNALGLEVGDKLELEEKDGVATLRPVAARFSRSGKKSAAEIFGAYAGGYNAPSDWGSHANEIDWGSAAGKELSW